MSQVGNSLECRPHLQMIKLESKELTGYILKICDLTDSIMKSIESRDRDAEQYYRDSIVVINFAIAAEISRLEDEYLSVCENKN